MPARRTVTMTFHIDPELKREVTEIVRDYGLNLTSVTRAFYKQIVRDGSIPLSFRHDAKGIESPYEMLGVPEASGEAEGLSDEAGTPDTTPSAASKEPDEALIG